MQLTYKLNTGELNSKLLAYIKRNFKDFQIEIKILPPSDETEYLLSNPANKKHLLESRDEETVKSFSLEELNQFANELKTGRK